MAIDMSNIRTVRDILGDIPILVLPCVVVNLTFLIILIVLKLADPG